ncbi:hypothetical protein SAMN06264855_104183 [Halorubrum vacuolatum]|uniref:Uncharacterized protein n=1 Tax=Halorubrum vacuolatum TaxID=63740 RepID=A0A238VX42_HALVU|nr:hypothetical protein SAMN06264855_104183 [Halorubrum vacuolatum]
MTDEAPTEGSVGDLAIETRGVLAPSTAEEAAREYGEAGPAAQVVVRETAKAMAFDAAEYDERVTSDVIETARDAIFAELLVVNVADRSTFEAWLERSQFDPDDVVLLGGENVDGVVWHPVPFAETVIAATYHEAVDAAVSTLRRNAFGRVYRGVFAEADGGEKGSRVD